MSTSWMDKSLLKIYETIETMSTLTCSKCNAETSFQMDADDAAELFHQKGWRATDKNVYCPQCAEKFKIK